MHQHVLHIFKGEVEDQKKTKLPFYRQLFAEDKSHVEALPCLLNTTSALLLFLETDMNKVYQININQCDRFPSHGDKIARLCEAQRTSRKKN